MTTTRKYRMELSLPNDREILMSRKLDAPRALVFEVWTKPEHIVRWWGCGTMSMPVCDADLRPGGTYRYVLREDNGQEHPFTGTYRVVEPPSRLVHTQIYDVAPFNEHEAEVTVTFTEEDGVTTVSERVRHASQAARDGHLQSGMEEGAATSFDRLEDLVLAMHISSGA